MLNSQDRILSNLPSKYYQSIYKNIKQTSIQHFSQTILLKDDWEEKHLSIKIKMLVLTSESIQKLVIPENISKNSSREMHTPSKFSTSFSNIHSPHRQVKVFVSQGSKLLSIVNNSKKWMSLLVLYPWIILRNYFSLRILYA